MECAYVDLISFIQVTDFDQYIVQFRVGIVWLI